MYPMNYYYGPYFRRPVQRLDQGGIPAIRSVAVTNPLCVVVEEDGECDGTGSLLF